MRAFIILGFLVAAASAASLGYNYGPGVSGSTHGGGGLIGGGSLGGGKFVGGGGHGGSGGLVGAGSELIGSRGTIISSGGGLIGGGGGLIGTGGGHISSGGGLIGTGGGIIGSGGRLIGGSLGGGSLGGGSLGGGIIRTSGVGLGGGLGGGIGGGIGGGQGGTTVLGLNALDSIPQTVEYSKQFFYFTAPEEAHDEGSVTQQLSNVLKKNLQVVFIKAPENNAATNAALQLAKQAIEQRTAIYVLSKENDASQVVGQLQQIQENIPTTPEVRFIKYRTPEDVAYAREVIQSQYDNFGGSSQVIDGGVAPVLNYASPGSGSTLVLGGGLGSSGSGVLLGGGSSGLSSGGSGILLGGGSSGLSSGGSGILLGGGSSGIKYSGGGSGTLLGTGLGSVGKVIGGGGHYYTGSASTTNADYLPPSLRKK